MTAHRADRLASYLAGSNPSSNPPVTLGEANVALAAEIDLRFLTPDGDPALGRRALDAAAEAPPGGVEEALAVRGLLPDGLASPRAFDVAMPPGVPVWWADPSAVDADTSLPFLIKRWPAVSAALALLDEAAERLAPWGWLDARHRVVVAPRANVARVIDARASYPTGTLRMLLGGENASRVAWPTKNGITYDYLVSHATFNQQSRVLLGAHNSWRTRVAAGARAPGWRSIPRSARGRPFADLPDPFAPLVDVLRLGLGVGVGSEEGIQLVLFVPR